MSMQFEWADAGPMTIWNDARLQEVSDDEVRPGEIGVSLDTGSNGIMIWGERDALIQMAEDLAQRLRAGEGASRYGEERAFVLAGPGQEVSDPDGDVYEAEQLSKGDLFRENFTEQVAGLFVPPAGDLWEVTAPGRYSQTSEGVGYVIHARRVIED